MKIIILKCYRLEANLGSRVLAAGIRIYLCMCVLLHLSYFFLFCINLNLYQVDLETYQIIKNFPKTIAVPTPHMCTPPPVIWKLGKSVVIPDTYREVLDFFSLSLLYTLGKKCLLFWMQGDMGNKCSVIACIHTSM